MFKKAIMSFHENLEALRGFVEITEPHLTRHQLEISRINADKLVEIISAKLDIPPDEIKIVLEKGSNIEDKVANTDNINKIELVDISVIKLIANALLAINRANKQTEILFQSSLISLLSMAEMFLADILRSYYLMYPEAIGTSEKLQFDELNQFSSVQEIKEHFIEKKIEDIMRKSFIDLISFCKNELKLNMGYLGECNENLNEVFIRRNVIVHNGGTVNSIYMSKVKSNLRKDLELGDKLIVDREYLDESIDMFEFIFILIACELWKKIEKESVNRGDVLLSISFSHIENSRWCIAKALCTFAINDKNLNEKARLYSQLNLWQCYKWEGIFEEVKDDVMLFDVSAKGLLYQLVKLALLDDYDKFFDLLPSAISSKEISLEALKEWPIFTKIREQEGFTDYQ